MTLVNDIPTLLWTCSVRNEIVDARPQNLHTFSKVNLKYIQLPSTEGLARYSFHLPSSCYLQILLARDKRARTNIEPWQWFHFFQQKMDKLNCIWIPSFYREFVGSLWCICSNLTLINQFLPHRDRRLIFRIPFSRFLWFRQFLLLHVMPIRLLIHTQDKMIGIWVWSGMRVPEDIPVYLMTYVRLKTYSYYM